MAAQRAASDRQLFSMTIDDRGETAIVVCHGRIVSQTCAGLRAQIKALLPQRRAIHLDLGDVDHIDSSGLGALLAMYVSTTSAGCELRLVNAQQRVRDLLQMTHLAPVFGLPAD